MIERSWRAALSIQTGLVQASWTGVRLMIGYRALGLGADPFFLGLLASAFALPALLAGLPAGRLSDKTGGSVVALTGMVIAAAGTIGAFSLPGRWTLLAAAGCVGLGQMLIMIGQQTFVANASAHRGSDSSVRYADRRGVDRAADRAAAGYRAGVAGDGRRKEQSQHQRRTRCVRSTCRPRHAGLSRSAPV